MMQQLAAKQSDIAGLGIGKEDTPVSLLQVPQPEGSHAGFGDVYREASAASSAVSRKALPADTKKSAEVVGPKEDRLHHTDSHVKSEAAEAAERSDEPSVPVSKTGQKPTEAKAAPQDEPEGTQTADVPSDDELEKLVSDEHTDVDWLAYVDAVKSASEKLDANTPVSTLDDSVIGESVSYSEQFEIAGVVIEQNVNAESDSEPVVTVNSEEEASLSATKNDTGVNPDEQMNDNAVMESSTLSALPEQQDQTLLDVMKALDDALTSAGRAVQKPTPETLKTALQSLKSQTEQGSVQRRIIDNMLTAITHAESISQDSGEQASSETAALIANELLALSQRATAPRDTQTRASLPDSVSRAPSSATEPLQVLTEDLMTLSSASVETVTDTLQTAVTSLLAGASDEVQQSVKASLTAGMTEMQQQLTKGHEPGIDLKVLIQQALAEAGVSQSQAQAVVTQIEQQAAQLHQTVTAAQQSLQQIVANQVASADTVIQENSQVRAESGKALHGGDLADKPVNIHKAEGQQQLQEKIRWMVNSRTSLAEIRLDPPELGSMQVRVSMNGDAASVSFVVQSAQARDALNDAMPRLREMFAEQGVTLGESFVSQEQQDQGASPEDGSAGGGNGEFAADAEDEMPASEQRLTRNELGGIDYYA
ncbi:flagellar hook-length control protein FliK [Alteromonas sp. CYL-A6]|uniref:flagellar hook-length control protein FliK n=1 Tax=Alteromonas nitratireducens TaxID=3390813 RepID=UPI0034C17CEF